MAALRPGSIHAESEINDPLLYIIEAAEGIARTDFDLPMLKLTAKFPDHRRQQILARRAARSQSQAAAAPARKVLQFAARLAHFC